jgi:hypothetical protein
LTRGILSRAGTIRERRKGKVAAFRPTHRLLCLKAVTSREVGTVSLLAAIESTGSDTAAPIPYLIDPQPISIW